MTDETRKYLSGSLFASTSAFDSEPPPLPPPVPHVVLSNSQQFKQIADLIAEALDVLDVLDPDLPELESALSALDAALDLARQHA